MYLETRQNEVEEKSQLIDYQAWLTGSYFVHALSNFGMMVKKPKPYPNEPFYVSRQNTEKEKTAPKKEQTIEEQQSELIACLMGYKLATKKGG